MRQIECQAVWQDAESLIELGAPMSIIIGPPMSIMGGPRSMPPFLSKGENGPGGPLPPNPPANELMHAQEGLKSGSEPLVDTLHCSTLEAQIFPDTSVVRHLSGRSRHQHQSTNLADGLRAVRYFSGCADCNPPILLGAVREHNAYRLQ